MLFRFSVWRWIALILLFPLLTGATPSRATERIEDRLKRFATALQEAEASTQPSSSLVPIAGQGLLEVPEGTRFVPAEQTRAFMESVGNPPSHSIVGMIIPQDFYVNPDWAIIIRWDDDGFVDESRFKNLTDQQVVRSIEKTVAAQNKIRQKTGLPALHLKNMLLYPHCDTVNHSAEYALNGTIEGLDKEAVVFIHYFMGRNGIVSFNFVGTTRPLDAIYPIINPINQHFSYLAGHDYTDFDPAHDRRAPYEHEIALPSWQRIGSSVLVAFSLYWLRRRRNKKLP